MTDKFPVARCIYLGKTVLGYPEREVWHMTLRKLMLLYDEYRKEHGQKSAEMTIDDMIPV